MKIVSHRDHVKWRRWWLYNTPAAMQGQVKVTPARWWHMPGLSRLIRETRRRRAAGGALLWAPQWSPSLGLLQSVWTTPMPGVAGPRSFVAEQDGRPVGLAQMKPRREPQQWEVVYLAVEHLTTAAREAPSGGALRPAPDRRAATLLGELCDAGVLLGAERLFARILEDDLRLELFKQVGFSPVAREHTYYRPLRPQAGGPESQPSPPPAIPGLRPQRRADSFGVLQLYQECTPKTVQMAEGKRSHSWDLPADTFGGRLTRQTRVQRWVVEQDARKVAWLQVGIRRHGPHVVRMMVDPRVAELSEPLLRHALAALPARPAGGVQVRAREHQQSLISALEAQGFYQVDGDLLMVKLLAAPVVQPQLARALEKVV